MNKHFQSDLLPDTCMHEPLARLQTTQKQAQTRSKGKLDSFPLIFTPSLKTVSISSDWNTECAAPPPEPYANLPWIEGCYFCSSLQKHTASEADIWHWTQRASSWPGEACFVQATTPISSLSPISASLPPASISSYSDTFYIETVALI